MKFLLKLDCIIERLQTYMSVIMFMAIITIVFVGVIFRYVFNNSLVWAEEVLRFLAIWLIIVGSSLTVREERHVAIDVLQSSVKSEKLKMALYIFTRMVAAAFLIILFPASIELMMRAQNSIANTVPITFFWVYLSFLVGVVLMLCSFASVVPRQAKKIKKGEII